MGNRKETLEGIQRLVRRSRSKSLSPEEASIDTPKILDDLRSMSHTLRGSTERGLKAVKGRKIPAHRQTTNYMNTSALTNIEYDNKEDRLLYLTDIKKFQPEYILFRGNKNK